MRQFWLHHHPTCSREDFIHAPHAAPTDRSRRLRHHSILHETRRTRRSAATIYPKRPFFCPTHRQLRLARRRHPPGSSANRADRCAEQRPDVRAGWHRPRSGARIGFVLADRDHRQAGRRTVEQPPVPRRRCRVWTLRRRVAGVGGTASASASPVSSISNPRQRANQDQRACVCSSGRSPSRRSRGGQVTSSRASRSAPAPLGDPGRRRSRGAGLASSARLARRTEPP